MPASDLHTATRAARTPRSVPWYRTPLDPREFKRLHERSDVKGTAYAATHLLLLATTGAAAVLAGTRGWAFPWVLLTAGLLFLHGTCGAFLLNALHELCHGTVFRSKRLNEAFLRLFSFLFWFNYPIFQASHARHHRYTLHPPDDLEVVLPIKILLRQLLLGGFANPAMAFRTLREVVRVARGRMTGEWRQTLFPDAASRREPVRWARVMLAGHAVVLAVAVAAKLWLLPVVVSLMPFYGRLLESFCNETQHIGLQDNVADFRLCTRTFLPNPAIRFLYWQMNYHIEHHMYAAVPCYNLPRLHRLIAYDLPPSPRGLFATWRDIFRIQKMQERDPSYVFVPDIPAPRTAAPAKNSGLDGFPG